MPSAPRARLGQEPLPSRKSMWLRWALGPGQEPGHPEGAEDSSLPLFRTCVPHAPCFRGHTPTGSPSWTEGPRASADDTAWAGRRPDVMPTPPNAGVCSKVDTPGKASPFGVPSVTLCPPGWWASCACRKGRRDSGPHLLLNPVFASRTSSWVRAGEEGALPPAPRPTPPRSCQLP